MDWGHCKLVRFLLYDQHNSDVSGGSGRGGHRQDVELQPWWAKWD